MYNKLVFIALTALIQNNLCSAQRQWVPQTTTAAEMRNPYTWYWPYAIAASEGYRNYFQNAQQITNQLYQQAYATQAFPWTSQPGQVAAQATGQAGQTVNPNGQGGQGWNGGPGGQNWNPGQGGQGGQNWNPGQGGQGWNGGQNGQGGQGWTGPGFLET